MTAVINFFQKHKLLIILIALLILLIVLNGYFKLVTIPGFFALLRKLDKDRKTRNEYTESINTIKGGIEKQQQSNIETRTIYQEEKATYNRELQEITQKKDDLNRLSTDELTNRVVKELEKKGVI